MNITLGGVRGTGTMSGPECRVYGGETISALIESADGKARIILDAGTGIRALGKALKQSPGDGQVLLLMTHYHLDHVMGLPSLCLLYLKEWKVRLAAPLHEGLSVEEAVRRLLEKPFWPVPLGRMGASVAFETLDGPASLVPLRWGDLEIRWCGGHHPDGCTVYRVDEPATEQAIVFATDVEWALSTPYEKAAFRQLCASPRPPSLLLFDGSYTPAEYPKFKGWGHSSWADCVEVAREVHAGKLAIFHHIPFRGDEELGKIESEVRQVMPSALLARCGTILEAGKI